MKKEEIKEFLNFRKKFTKREWFEINQAVLNRENEKAAKITLDDSDIKAIFTNIENSSWVKNR